MLVFQTTVTLAATSAPRFSRQATFNLVLFLVPLSLLPPPRDTWLCAGSDRRQPRERSPQTLPADGLCAPRHLLHTLTHIQVPQLTSTYTFYRRVLRHTSTPRDMRASGHTQTHYLLPNVHMDTNTHSYLHKCPSLPGAARRPANTTVLRCLLSSGPCRLGGS